MWALFLLLAFLGSIEAGDDATYCVNECVKKFETEVTNSTVAKVSTSPPQANLQSSTISSPCTHFSARCSSQVGRRRLTKPWNAPLIARCEGLPAGRWLRAGFNVPTLSALVFHSRWLVPPT